MKISSIVKHASLKIIIGSLLFINLIMLSMRFLLDDYPRWIPPASNLLSSIIILYVYTKYSKLIPSRSLLEHWFKSSHAFHLLNEFIKQDRISLSQNDLDSISNYNKLNDDIESLLIDNGEIQKLRKLQKRIYYLEPKNITEALSDCFRSSNELKKMLKKRKFSYLHQYKFDESIIDVHIGLKEMYKLIAFPNQLKIPKWVRE